jgi:high-affinity iron transporter
MLKKLLILTLLLIVVIQPALKPMAAENHDELFVLIGDSMMKAKSGDMDTVAKNISQFSQEWESIRNTNSKQVKKVNQALKQVQGLLDKKNAENEDLSKSLSALSRAVVQYEQEQNPANTASDKEKVKALLPYITKLKVAIEDGKPAQINSAYQTVMNQWTSAETIVHDQSIASYGNIEKYTALIRIAITQEPADMNKAESNVDLLFNEVEDVIAGKAAKQSSEDYSLSDLASLLNKAENEIASGSGQKAGAALNEALNIWPMVEGDVQTRDSKLYNDIETKIPTAISILNSKNGDFGKAQDIVKDLSSRVAPLVSKTDYSIWDAALILLREGMEGLLIVVTLIAFLKKMGQTSQQKWIWAGVGAGVVASAILAVIINLIFSKMVAASSREYIEGITGVVAVIMMLTIGAWLHNKSSIQRWNQFIRKQMNEAIAKGSLVSFAAISFLSVFREGAETIIFYAGITPYIGLQQLVLGIVTAIVVLAAVGYAIIHYSVKIPIHLFFKVATVLIYFLAFKILGISIHALQISNVISMSTVENLPFIDWLGLYPTLETTVTQVCLLALILLMTWKVKKKTATVNA